MAITVNELLDSIHDAFAKEEVKAYDISVYAESDENSVSIVEKNGSKIEVVYVTEEDDEPFTVADLYEKLRKINPKGGDEVVLVCDDQDKDDESEPVPVKSVKCDVHDKTVILRTK